ncbi:hypothetical protein [Campylobacter vulpis]|uniref:DUF5644 domain-containing protein n=1 Tax=Campylobacter vulpis TaxID=1655500 RepID=A0ABS5P1F8_9BACT|nr:hypothetical protein [Campylobacter vulpis]MBS4240521.1 hypothetical protein [Campylobacter vulpis]MBS4251936.1 hypothetical protein [Campylobacter vulpis]MBS4281111.1 hypothetical protein [Campylobacter vulpis]MBS4329392.1 hypothetical protein [Campylobacter vulpis]
MTLEFNFTYLANNEIFEYLLKFYAKNYHFEFKKEEENYTLKISGEEEELKDFCDILSKMSYSVFLKDFEVKAAQDFTPKKSEEREYQTYALLTHLNANAYDKNGFLCENEWGVFCESELKIGKNFERITKENFNFFLEKSLKLLKNHQSIYLKNHSGIYAISLFAKDFKGDFLMPCKLEDLRSIFVCNDQILKLLASVEKPLISLKINAAFRQKHALNFNEFKVKLADDLFLYALGLKFEDTHFLSFKKLESFNEEFELLNYEERLVVLRGFDFVAKRARELIFSKEDKNMAKLSYLASLEGENALILELSEDYEDILLLNRELNLLNLKLPKHSKELYEEIRKDEIGSRLLTNFQKEFALLDEALETQNNFFSLFGILGRILDLKPTLREAAFALLALADSAKIPRGVKIDYRLKENKEFDYTRTLRSAMSFMLAGVEKNNIAYGAVESLGYFLRDTYDDLREKKQVDKALISGSLFSHKSLLKITLKHLKNSKLSDVPLYI